MKTRLLATVIIAACSMLGTHQAKGQTKPSIDLPKYEVSADFTTFTVNGNQLNLGRAEDLPITSTRASRSKPRLIFPQARAIAVQVRSPVELGKGCSA